ncbi:substrate-binding periplasmic protein [Neptuniibacter marinus]|uniref:substrate-binding periplasmic protein n=1 Tax=Neptuniibacter marinus TaxID=1806670 RepID=UPI0008358C3D|nr:transporter substrate-binding domain-containing protein [Neptuniibacter marinus]
MRCFKSEFYSFAALILFLFIPAAQSAEQQVEPITLYTVNYPPYSIIRSDGAFEGVDVDVVRAAFLAVGINIHFKTAPWKRILKNIQHGYILASITCSKRPDRSAYIKYSDPISVANQVAVMASASDASALVKFSDLNKFEVTVVDGWGIEKELTDSGIEHTTTPSISSGINAVLNRGVDVFYNGDAATLFVAKKLGVQDQIKIKHFVDREATLFHLCFSKKNHNTEYLVHQFNKGLKVIKKNGTYQAIYEKYLSSNLITNY